MAVRTPRVISDPIAEAPLVKGAKATVRMVGGRVRREDLVFADGADEKSVSGSSSNGSSPSNDLCHVFEFTKEHF